MNFDFPLILLCATVFTGVVMLVDVVIMYIKRARGIKEPYQRKVHWIIEYSRAFFPVLLIVLLIRSFIAQPYRVPTGSLEPTIMTGDFILVNQYEYGLFSPVWHKELLHFSEPKRGQIALFYNPVNPNITFVKRVVGVPGDRISYVNKVFYINGKQMQQTYLGNAFDEEAGTEIPVKVYQEDLMGIQHKIYINPEQAGTDFHNLVVPQGEYLMIGDNRDDSDDSRYWGLVKANDFIGKALFVWMNWNSDAKHWYDTIGWHRIGTKL